MDELDTPFTFTGSEEWIGSGLTRFETKTTLSHSASLILYRGVALGCARRYMEKEGS